jgi:hypothetical protein
MLLDITVYGWIKHDALYFSNLFVRGEFVNYLLRRFESSGNISRFSGITSLLRPELWSDVEGSFWAMKARFY